MARQCLMVICQLITAIIVLRRRMRARRVELLSLVEACLALPRRPSPQVWQRHRSSVWWEVDVLGHFTEHQWITYFRMSRETFGELCSALEPHLRPNTPSRRPAVPTRKRVAIALYKLASCCEYRVVAGKFGVSITTVHRCVYSVCRTIRCHLLRHYINMPSAEEAQQIAYKNAMKHHIPQVSVGYERMDALPAVSAQVMSIIGNVLRSHFITLKYISLQNYAQFMEWRKLGCLNA